MLGEYLTLETRFLNSTDLDDESFNLFFPPLDVDIVLVADLLDFLSTVGSLGFELRLLTDSAAARR